MQDVRAIAEELNVSIGTAANVAYLRTRPEHCSGLEEDLIRLCESGNPPNLPEWIEMAVYAGPEEEDGPWAEGWEKRSGTHHEVI